MHNPEELCKLAHVVHEFDYLAAKMASDEGSSFAQMVHSVGAQELYNVILKEAQEFAQEPGPLHQKVSTYLDQLVQSTGKSPIPKTTKVKMAAVVTANEALTTVLDSAEKTAEDRGKLWAMRQFGKEYFINLLHEATH